MQRAFPLATFKALHERGIFPGNIQRLDQLISMDEALKLTTDTFIDYAVSYFEIHQHLPKEALDKIAKYDYCSILLCRNRGTYEYWDNNYVDEKDPQNHVRGQHYNLKKLSVANIIKLIKNISTANNDVSDFIPLLLTDEFLRNCCRDLELQKLLKALPEAIVTDIIQNRLNGRIISEFIASLKNHSSKLSVALAIKTCQELPPCAQ